MSHEGFHDGRDEQGKGIVPSSGSDIERVNDPDVENLIRLLSQPRRSLTREQDLDDIAKRQEAVSKFLIRGGSEALRKLFGTIEQWERSQPKPVKFDLSMLELSGRLLGRLYLPGANLAQLVFAGSDITGSDITGANLTEAVAPMAIMRGVTATGAKWENAVIPGSDMKDGRFIGCSFINTVMTDVIVDDKTNFTGAVFIGTYIGNTDLSKAITTGAIFRGIRR